MRAACQARAAGSCASSCRRAASAARLRLQRTRSVSTSSGEVSACNSSRACDSATSARSSHTRFEAGSSSADRSAGRVRPRTSPARPQRAPRRRHSVRGWGWECPPGTPGSLRRTARARGGVGAVLVRPDDAGADRITGPGVALPALRQHRRTPTRRARRGMVLRTVKGRFGCSVCTPCRRCLHPVAPSLHPVLVSGAQTLHPVQGVIHRPVSPVDCQVPAARATVGALHVRGHDRGIGRADQLQVLRRTQRVLDGPLRQAGVPDQSGHGGEGVAAVRVGVVRQAQQDDGQRRGVAAAAGDRGVVERPRDGFEAHRVPHMELQAWEDRVTAGTSSVWV
jgi:hypothetical protein